MHTSALNVVANLRTKQQTNCTKVCVDDHQCKKEELETVENYPKFAGTSCSNACIQLALAGQTLYGA